MSIAQPSTKAYHNLHPFPYPGSPRGVCQEHPPAPRSAHRADREYIAGIATSTASVDCTEAGWDRRLQEEVVCWLSCSIEYEIVAGCA
jgi:hypothetical protein